MKGPFATKQLPPPNLHSLTPSLTLNQELVERKKDRVTPEEAQAMKQAFERIEAELTLKRSARCWYESLSDSPELLTH